jgi:hypothetical protein
MIGCKINGPRGFQRIYWKNTIVDQSQLHGATTRNDLRKMMPAGASFEILLGQDKFVVCTNGDIELTVGSTNPIRFTQGVIFRAGDGPCPAVLGRLGRNPIEPTMAFTIQSIDSKTYKP